MQVSDNPFICLGYLKAIESKDKEFWVTLYKVVDKSLLTP
jgi:hypothetical protein